MFKLFSFLSKGAELKDERLDDSDFNEDDIEPPIERAALMLIPKQPYLDWLLSWDKDTELDLKTAHRDAVVYLIPPFESKEHMKAYLNKQYLRMFENELKTWTTEKKLWPKKLTKALFNQWFDIEFRDMVVDLV